MITDPESPTSPRRGGLADRGSALISPTTLPNISTGKVIDTQTPSKTANNGFAFASNPNSTLSGVANQAQLARMTTTGTAFYDKHKQDAQAERLIHSVNAVTDLLKANTELRNNMERVERDLEQKDAENI